MRNPHKEGTCSVLKMTRVEEAKGGFWWESPVGMTAMNLKVCSQGRCCKWRTSLCSPRVASRLSNNSMYHTPGRAVVGISYLEGGSDPCRPRWKISCYDVNCCCSHKETVIGSVAENLVLIHRLNQLKLLNTIPGQRWQESRSKFFGMYVCMYKRMNKK